MNNKLSTIERRHLARVKELPCSVCDSPPPSEAHHIEQGLHFAAVALCAGCHRGSMMGLHGQRRMWAIKKMSELEALDVTIRRMSKAHRAAQDNQTTTD